MRTKAREIDIQPSEHVAFIHIPKTAGTTFNALLEPLLAGLSSCPEYFLPGLVRFDLDDLRNFQVFRGHFPYALFSDILFPEGFIGLTFLRDPVERTTSNFRFIHHLLERDSLPELPQYADELEQIRSLSLAELLEHTELRIYKDLANIQTNFMGTTMSPQVVMPAVLPEASPLKNSVLQARYKQLRSRVSDLSRLDEDGDITPATLNLAKERLKEIAFLGLVERFQDSLFLLSYTFGWRPILDATRLNASPQGDETETADPELPARIRDSVNLDLQLYQFGQDIFESRFDGMTRTLLSRYGTEKHAGLRGRLPVDVMIQFLEQHYIDRRARRTRQTGTPVDEYLYRPAMRVDGPFGWYRPDFSPEYGPICWSGPELHSGFDLPCPNGAKIRVSFRILAAVHPAIIEQLSLTVNETPLALDRSVDANGAFIFEGDIQAAAVSRSFLRLVFTVPMTLVPGTVDPDNRDPRQLGILLNWVKLQAH